MAILAAIRSKGILLIVIIALALFAFIIGDLLRQGTFGGASQDTVGIIGDTKINRETFARQVQNFTQGRQGTTETQAAEALWNQEIRNVILAKEIDEAGISVSDEAVSEYLTQSYSQFPQFQDETGAFSEAKMYSFVEDLKKNDPARYQLWQQDVENAAKQVAQQQFFTLVKSGIIGSSAAGKFEYHLANDTRDFEFVMVPYTSIKDSDIKVTKAEVKKYVDEHPKEFEAEAQRGIWYTVFENKASNEDLSDLKKELKNLVDDSQVFNQNTNNSETRIGLKNTAEPEEYAAEYSDMPADASYMATSKLPQGANALNSASAGAIVGPYEDAGYLKISRLLDKKVIMDSVKNRHILISYAGAERADPSIKRTKDQAKKVADSILGTIGQNKATFDTQFDYFTTTTDLAVGQDIGWVVNSGNASGFAPGFTKFLFDNASGTIGIAESTFGYHIIRIDETKSPINTVKLATISRKIQPSKNTDKKQFNTVQKYQQAVASKPMYQVAKSFNVIALPLNNISAMEENLPGLPNNRSIVKWAFNDDRSIGDVERFETTQGYVIAKLTRKSEKGVMSVENATPLVENILRNKKKAEIIQKRIKSINLDEIAKNNNSKVQLATTVNRKNTIIPTGGNEPRVVGTAFGLKKDAVSKPIEGEQGVFVVKVIGISNAPEIANYSKNANELATQMANQSTSLLIESLKKKLDIKDYRSNFY